jgi:hypothetical protein
MVVRAGVWCWQHRLPARSDRSRSLVVMPQSSLGSQAFRISAIGTALHIGKLTSSISTPTADTFGKRDILRKVSCPS